MAAFELRILGAAAKELDALPRKKDRQAVTRRIAALAADPRPPGSVKLSGRKELYRVRQGPYRIIYTIEEGCLVIVVIRIGARKDVTRKVGRHVQHRGHGPLSNDAAVKSRLLPPPPPTPPTGS